MPCATNLSPHALQQTWKLRRAEQHSWHSNADQRELENIEVSQVDESVLLTMVARDSGAMS